MTPVDLDALKAVLPRKDGVAVLTAYEMAPAMIAEITALREQNARMTEALSSLRYDAEFMPYTNRHGNLVRGRQKILACIDTALNPEK